MVWHQLVQPLSLVGEPAVPLVTSLVHDSSPRVRRAAMDVLKQIGPPASASASEIARHLDDPNEQVRLAARSALETLNPQLLSP